MGEVALSGQRFRRFPHPYSGQSTDLEPLLNGNVEPWSHLKELLQSYTADWVKDELKYGHFDSVPPPIFENQIFEEPDTDVETELRLSNIRLGRHGDATDDEDPTTSGRYSGGLFSGRFSGRSTASDFPDSTVARAPKHYGGPSLPPYEPVFNWRVARASVFGYRTPEIPSALSLRSFELNCELA